MNLKYKYWFFQEAVPHRICDEIIDCCNMLREVKAITGNQGKENKIDDSKLHKQRNSHVAWTSDQWIYKEIQPYVHLANKNAGWNFELNRAESIQFTKYKLNQHYDWHRDSWDEPYNKPEEDVLNGLIRKISIIVSLSDEKDYEGGVLQMDFKDGRHGTDNIVNCDQIAKKGSVVVFPSFMWHRVTPVTSGIRYSLVNWTCGYPFK